MADPIVIAHVLGDQGERLCKAPDTPMSVDLTAEVAARGRWDGTSVVLCRRCDDALRLVPQPASIDAKRALPVAVGASS